MNFEIVSASLFIRDSAEGTVRQSRCMCAFGVPMLGATEVPRVPKQR